MTRSNIERNRRIHQVRTVVWEDGAVRPLLPDPHGSTQNVVQGFSMASGVLTLRNGSVVTMEEMIRSGEKYELSLPGIA